MHFAELHPMAALEVCGMMTDERVNDGNRTGATEYGSESKRQD
jgi:hypothetical protein